MSVEPLEGDGAWNAVDGGVHEDVLARGSFIVEAGAQFEQRHHASTAADAPGRGRDHLGDDLEQRRLASPVAADHAEDGTVLDLEGHVLQRPHFLRTHQLAGQGDRKEGPQPLEARFGSLRLLRPRHEIPLADVLDDEAIHDNWIELRPLSHT